MTYSFCPFDVQADRERVLDLWSENLPESSHDRYPWLYERGPSTGWLVKATVADAVGAVGLMNRTLRVFGETLRAGQPIDLNILAEHRTAGPALGLQRALTSTVDNGDLDLLYAFPNAASELVQRRAGFRVLGTLNRWAKPLAVGEHVASRIRNPIARGIAANLANPLLKLTSRELYYRRPASVRVTVADRFDSRFDRLWEAAADQFPIVGERTAAYLDWRFTQCPDARYRTLCLLNEYDELLAYLVFHQRQTLIHIGDLFFVDSWHVDTLLAELLHLARKQRAEAVVTISLGSPIVGERLKKFGFLQRPCEWKAVLFFNRQMAAEMADRLCDADNWHLTPADIDTDG